MRVCEECNTGRLKLGRGPYHYTESGLPDILLSNVKWWQCSQCKASEAVIPKVGELHRCIAWNVVTKSSILTGSEIVFLRKMLRKPQGELAEIVGVNQVVLSRWETGARKPGKANDAKLRFLYLALQNDGYTRQLHSKLWELLFRYFGTVKGKATPVKARIDPEKCSATEVVNATLARLASLAAADQRHHANC